MPAFSLSGVARRAIRLYLHSTRAFFALARDSASDDLLCCLCLFVAIFRHRNARARKIQLNFFSLFCVLASSFLVFFSKGVFAVKAARWRRNAELEESGITTRDPRVKHVVKLLHSHPFLRTRELAKMVGLAASYLQHLFTREVGVSITIYSLEIRLRRAWRLLTTTSLSLKEIAHRVGISDASNFSRRFKQRFGMPPGTLRKSCSDQ